MIYVALITLSSNVYSAPIIGGENVPENQAKAIINIFGTNADDETGGSCTASKIGDRFILTAAHCVLGKDMSKLGWSNASKIDLNNEETNIFGLYTKKVSVHPSYELDMMLGKRFEASDIAIIEVDLSQGNYVDQFKNLPSMELDFSPVIAGEELDSYGYGCESTGDVGNPVSNKKVAKFEMLSHAALAYECSSAHPYVNQNASSIYKSQMVSPTVLTGNDASMCEGDSGGPVLRNGKIVGVNSAYLIDQSSPNEEAYLNLHSRVSEAQTWIKSVVR